MIKSSSRVICDAGPLIHLDEINCLNLLNSFEEIILQLSVEREIAAYRPSALAGSSLTVRRQAENLDIGEKLLVLSQIFSLDAGETEALILMESNPNHQPQTTGAFEISRKLITLPTHSGINEGLAADITHKAKEAFQI